MSRQDELHTLIFQGDIEGATRLLQAGVNLNGRNSRGGMAVDAALSSDQPEMLRFVLTHGADGRVDLGGGWTPLHEAAEIALDGMTQNELAVPDSASLEMIDILLAHGADPTRADRQGITAAILLIRLGYSY